MSKILLLKLFTLFLFQIAAAQGKKISGKVSDPDGKPLAGVSVQAKGSSVGTATTAEGFFSIDVPANTKLLVFSHAGMESREIATNSSDLANVQLFPRVATGDEVVVIGYGNVRKSDLTGSVSTLKNSEFNSGIISSPVQAMQGRIAGVAVSQTSAEPGGGVSIRIRGANSITAGNDPLFVIDGLPIDNSGNLDGAGGASIGANPNRKNLLASLNPADIQSIEVLKDASATAIYGSRGANGVVLITTKSGGRSGKAVINYDYSIGNQEILKKIDVLNAPEYINMINTYAAMAGAAPVFSAADSASIGKGTDWQDEIFRTAVVSNHSLSFSNGNDKSRYYISANYFDQPGIVRSTEAKKYIVKTNLEMDLSSKVRVGLNLNTSILKDKNSIDGQGYNEVSGPINAALLYDPTLPVRAADGSFFRSAQLSINNPVSLVEGVSSTSRTSRMFGNIFMNVKWTNHLSSKVFIGGDFQNARRDLYNSTMTIYGGAGGGTANIVSLERSNMLYEFTTSYVKNFNQNHAINAVAGVSYQKFDNRSVVSTISGFATDAIGTNNLGLGDRANAVVGSNKNDNKLQSYIGRVNYTLYDKVLLTASIRADGSSKFGTNNKYGYFPSFAAAYKLTGESFIPDFFSELKLRSSWGVTGNQDINNYASLSTIGTGGLAYLGGTVMTGTVPTRVANPDLKWETTKQFNAGLDFGILNSRISGSIDYFIKNTEDMLMNLPLPQSSGYGFILSNVGTMKNNGIEVMINTRNIVKPNFGWNSSIVFTSIKNEVTGIADLPEIINGGFISENVAVIRKGLSLSSYYGYRIDGIFQEHDDIAGSPQPNAKPGHPRFFDANGDKAITSADRVILGSPFPDFTFGVRNSFNFYNFELDVFIDGQYGAELLNGNAIESMYPTNDRRNRMAVQFLNRWVPGKTNAEWPSGFQPTSYAGGRVNSLTVEDASFLRLQSLQLAYNFKSIPGNVVKSARVYATAQNLFVLTDYTGYNPEANVLGNSNVRVDFNAYPLGRVFILGVSLNF